MAGFQKKIILTALAVFFLMLVVIAGLIRYNNNVKWFPEISKCPPYYKVVKDKGSQKVTCEKIERNVMKDFGEIKKMTKYFKKKNGDFVKDENENKIIQIRNLYGSLKNSFKIGEKVKICVPINPNGEIIKLNEDDKQKEYENCNTRDNDFWYYGTVTKINRKDGKITSYNIKFLPKEVTLKNDVGWDQIGKKRVTEEECIDCQNNNWVDCPPEISYSTCKKPRLLEKCGKYEIKNERGMLKSEKQKCMWANKCGLHWEGVSDPYDNCMGKSVLPGIFS